MAHCHMVFHRVHLWGPCCFHCLLLLFDLVLLGCSLREHGFSFDCYADDRQICVTLSRKGGGGGFLLKATFVLSGGNRGLGGPKLLELQSKENRSYGVSSQWPLYISPCLLVAPRHLIWIQQSRIWVLNWRVILNWPGKTGVVKSSFLFILANWLK